MLPGPGDLDRAISTARRVNGVRVRSKIIITGLVVAGVVGSLLAEWRASSDLADARTRYEEELRLEARNVRTRVENIFGQSHIALRSITRFPAISRFDPYRGFIPFSADPSYDLLEYSSSLRTCAEIFETLADTTGITDLYLTPYPYDPQALVDERKGVPRQPVVWFSRRADDGALTGKTVVRFAPTVGSMEEIAESDLSDDEAAARRRELWTRQLILNQLHFFTLNLPTDPEFLPEELPTICMELKELQGGSGGQNPFTRTADERHTYGLIHTTPIIGTLLEEDMLEPGRTAEVNRLRGAVSTVIPWEAIEAVLPQEGFVIRHPSRGISLIPAGNETAQRSELHWAAGEPDPNLYYSEVFPLAIPDTADNWELWTGRTGEAFASRAEVLGIRRWAIATHALLWLSVVALCFQTARQTRLRRRNDEALLAVRRAALEERASGEQVEQATRRATEEKNQFLSRLSHEIRTPMSAILGFADVLLDAKIDDDQRVEAVQSVRRNGRHLLHMIHDIIDLSKIEAGKLETQRLSVRTRTIIDEVVGLLEPRARARSTTLKVEIQGEVPELVQTDASRAQQALVNLVDNAIKYTEGGTVRLIVECNRAQERLRFRVVDDGVGMTSAQVARVFEPFQQSGDQKAVGSTGLGLAISFHIAKILGGAVSAESEPGKGSTFVLEIATGSLAGVPSMSATTEDPQAAESRAWSDLPHIDGRVLLVEDGPDNQTILAHILRRAGAEVVIANDGREGVDLALAARDEGRTFDAILMDIEMPVLDGLTATRQLRGAGYEGQIIALTAHAMAEDADRCIAAGCDHYLSKPVERAVLVHVVAQRVGLRSDARPAPAPPAP